MACGDDDSIDRSAHVVRYEPALEAPLSLKKHANEDVEACPNPRLLGLR
jgi:hypothetical protein